MDRAGFDQTACAQPIDDALDRGDIEVDEPAESILRTRAARVQLGGRGKWRLHQARRNFRPVGRRGRNDEPTIWLSLKYPSGYLLELFSAIFFEKRVAAAEKPSTFILIG